MRISFGALAGEKDQLLTQMRRTSLRRDPRAPIYITSEDLDSFEKRRDLTALRKLPSNDVVKAKIKYIRDSLEKLLIDRRRREYFENIDKGRPVEDLVNTRSTDPRERLHKGISDVARHIAPFFEDEVSNAELIQNLTGFLDGTRIIDNTRLNQPRPMDDQEKTTDKPTPCCLLCPSSSFSNPRSLSRHVWKTHEFEKQFYCPECQRVGNGLVTVAAGREAWSCHLVNYHDKIHVPNPVSAKTAYCPFCAKYATPRGFSLHYNQHRGRINRPFLCPECERQGRTHQIVGGDDSWISHVRKSHGGDWNVYGAVITGSDGQKAQSLGKRKMEDEDVPRKRVKTPEPESGLDVNWTAQCAGEHGEEEFWVTGYDGDYDEVVAYRGVY